MKKLFLCIISLLLVVNVYAQEPPNEAYVPNITITIEDLVSAFGNSETIKYLNDNSELNVRLVANETDETFDVYEGDTVVTRFTTEEDYIEYANDNPITDEEAMKQVREMFYISGMLEALLNLYGYEGWDISDEYESNMNYDLYGIAAVSESYTTSTTSGDFIRLFRVSVDKNKLDRLMETYGIEPQSTPTIDISTLKTKVKVSKTTAKSVEIKFSVDTEGVEMYYCDVYRALEENGEYTKLTEESVNCSKEKSTYIDNTVEDGKSYYYKVLVLGGSTEVPNVKATAEDIVKNPHTGVDDQLFNIIYVLYGSILLMLLLNKRKTISLN